MKTLTVLKAKRYGVYTCHTDLTLREAARKMVDQDISSLVVVDDGGVLLGIVTRVDLMRARHAGENWGDVTVGSAMSADVVAVSPEDTLDTVMSLLLERHIHRVVVVREEDNGPHPVAVLSAADVVYHMAREG
ncbi:MAG: CBS domain-containing protein [Caldilineaceae bacterium]|nr:CBS domain-containing protein [Caldilineaceae bacterium]